MTIDEQIENLKKIGLLFVDQIEMLFEKYEKVDIKTMGFIKEWKKLLEMNEEIK